MGEINKTQHTMISNLSEVKTTEQLTGLAQRIALLSGESVDKVLQKMSAQVNEELEVAGMEPKANPSNLLDVITSNKTSIGDKLDFEYSIYTSSAGKPWPPPPSKAGEGNNLIPQLNPWLSTVAFLTLIEMYFQDLARLESVMAKDQGVLAGKLMELTYELGMRQAESQLESSKLQAMMYFAQGATSAATAIASGGQAIAMTRISTAAKKEVKNELDKDESDWAKETNKLISQKEKLNGEVTSLKNGKGYPAGHDYQTEKISLDKGKKFDTNEVRTEDKIPDLVEGSPEQIEMKARVDSHDTQITDKKKEIKALEEKIDEKVGKRQEAMEQQLQTYYQSIVGSINSSIQAGEHFTQGTLQTLKGIAEYKAQEAGTENQVIGTALQLVMEDIGKLLKGVESLIEGSKQASQADINYSRYKG